MESARTLRRIVGIINLMTCCAEFLHHLCVILVSPTACYEIFAICGNACESKDSEIRLIGQREEITSGQALLPPLKLRQKGLVPATTPSAPLPKRKAVSVESPPQVSALPPTWFIGFRRADYRLTPVIVLPV